MKEQDGGNKISELWEEKSLADYKLVWKYQLHFTSGKVSRSGSKFQVEAGDKILNGHFPWN